jgi:hypothetical protein
MVGGDTLALHPVRFVCLGDLIGWMQDVNGNDTLNLIYKQRGSYALYYIRSDVMPQIYFK